MQNYLEDLEDIKQVAGEDLTNKLLDLISEKALINWFYKPNSEYENKSPYDICKENGQLREKLEDEINSLYLGQSSI